MQVLIIVVVLSMALTPTLADLGAKTANYLDKAIPPEGRDPSTGERLRAASEAAEEQEMLSHSVSHCLATLPRESSSPCLGFWFHTGEPAALSLAEVT